jgi:hypothetical protein
VSAVRSVYWFAAQHLLQVATIFAAIIVWKICTLDSVSIRWGQPGGRLFPLRRTVVSSRESGLSWRGGKLPMIRSMSASPSTLISLVDGLLTQGELAIASICCVLNLYSSLGF